jgi:hypothetical protein
MAYYSTLPCTMCTGSCHHHTHYVGVIMSHVHCAKWTVVAWQRSECSAGCSVPRSVHSALVCHRVSLDTVAIDKWQRYKSVKKGSCATFPACEGTWRAMNSTLTAVLSPGRTQHVHPCAATKTASPQTFVLHLPCTLTGCDTAGAEQVSTV